MSIVADAISPSNTLDQPGLDLGNGCHPPTSQKNVHELLTSFLNHCYRTQHAFKVKTLNAQCTSLLCPLCLAMQ